MMTTETVVALIVAGASLAGTIISHRRVSALPNKIRAEIKADATLAGALLIADAFSRVGKNKIGRTCR